MLRMTEKEFDLCADRDTDLSFRRGAAGPRILEEMEEKEVKSRATNRESSARGQAFEELIKFQCRKYKESDTAVIDKTPEPFRVYKKKPGGMFEGRFTGAKAQPDFQGTIKGGRSILIEAKSTGKDRIVYGVLTNTQQELLEMHSKAGAVCLVLCEIGEKHFSIPWAIWKSMKALYGHQYIKADEVKDYEITLGEGGAFPFLNVLEQYEEMAG